MSCRRPFLRAHRGLIAVTVGAAVVESALLLALDGRVNLALAPQVTAPPPFGTFHDVRWLLVYHHSWVTFALEAVALVLFRSALVTVLLRLAWPRHLSPPSWGEAARRALVYTPVAAVLLAPWAGLLFGMAVAPVSWLFFLAVPVVLAFAVFLHPAAVTTSWWRRLPPLRGVGWVLLAFLVLTLTAVTVTLAPRWLALPAAAACGLFNGWAWHGVVHAVVCRDRVPRPSMAFPFSPVAIAAVLAVVVGGVTVGFQLATGSADVRAAAYRHVAQVEEGTPVLIVTGFASSWDGSYRDRLPGTFWEQRFSYQGLAPDESPLPYGPEHTSRSLVELIRAMDLQVTGLADAAGTEISIVAESQGALVASAYLAAHADAPVQELVMLSPLVRPGKVYYPPAAEEGWGLMGGVQLRALAAAARALSPLPLSTSDPLLRSILDSGGLLRELLACPTPGVRRLALVPLADAVVAVPPEADGLDVSVVPAFHGGLLGNRSVTETVAAVLDGGEPPHLGLLALAERVIGAGATAWQVPELAASINPAWEPEADGRCGAVRADLQELLATASEPAPT